MKFMYSVLRTNRLVSVLFMLCACFGPVSAQYKLASFKGSVKVKSGEKTQTAAQGMNLKATDRMVIGQGSEAVVFDPKLSVEYTYRKNGEISVKDLIKAAAENAGSTLTTVKKNIGMSKPNTPKGNVFLEKGKTTLAQEEYNPGGEFYVINAQMLAVYLLNRMESCAPQELGKDFPTGLTCIHEGESWGFELDNTTAAPLYINVIKYDSRNGFHMSELGQPIGCYVMLPQQTMMRRQNQPALPGEYHILVASPYYFSIDELLECIGDDSLPAGSEVSDLPVFLSTF